MQGWYSLIFPITSQMWECSHACIACMGTCMLGLLCMCFDCARNLHTCTWLEKCLNRKAQSQAGWAGQAQTQFPLRVRANQSQLAEYHLFCMGISLHFVLTRANLELSQLRLNERIKLTYCSKFPCLSGLVPGSPQSSPKTLSETLSYCFTVKLVLKSLKGSRSN